MASTLLVGCYSNDGNGIYVYSLCESGRFTLQSIFGEHTNPTYLTQSGNRIYAACEQETGKLAALEIDGYRLRTINTIDIPGAATCHVTVHPANNLLFASNYVSGNEVTCRLSEDGSIGNIINQINYEEKSNCHCVAIDTDGTGTVSIDLGCDKVYVRSCEITDNVPLQQFQLPQDTGPRHFVFHPSGKFGYLITETANSIIGYNYNAHKLQQIQEIPLLPPDYKDQSYAAAIKISPCGKWLYASNRGFDHITLFGIDSQTGQLVQKGYYPTGGHWPRDFGFTPSGDIIIVANQKDNNLVSFAVDPQTGAIGEQLDIVTVANPACVVVL